MHSYSVRFSTLFAIIVLTFSIMVGVSGNKITPVAEQNGAEQINVVSLNLDEYYTLLSRGKCLNIYLYTGPVGFEWKSFWGNYFSGSSVYFTGGYNEYVDLMSNISNILGKNDVVLDYWLGGPRIAYPDEAPTPVEGFSGIVVYVNSNATEHDIQALRDGLGDLMEKNNLSVLVIVKVPSFTEPAPGIGSAKDSLRALLESTGEKPSYLDKLEQMEIEYPNLTLYDISSGDKEYSNLLLITFHEPMPTPTQDDLQELASWLTDKASEHGLCGYAIAIADHLEPVKEKNVGEPTIGTAGGDSHNSSNARGDGELMTHEGDNGGTGLGVIVIPVALIAGLASIVYVYRKAS